MFLSGEPRGDALTKSTANQWERLTLTGRNTLLSSGAFCIVTEEEITIYLVPKPVRPTPSAKNVTGDFGQFANFMRRLVAIPHSEIKAN